MKVLNLRCNNDHRFEGWFGSDADFASQGERGLIECPLCADKQISRMPNATRISIARQRSADAEPVASAQPVTPAQIQAQIQAQVQTHWMRAVRHMMANTEDVGERFPEEARRIHYGEVEERGIRGRASAEEAEALREEGIEVSALPVPAALKGPVQ